jgi:hypothetical protein
MKVEQVYSIVNALTQQYLGDTEVVNADLSNVVDIGSKTINLDNLDRYVRSLIDQIGEIRMVNRPYSGSAPSLYMDSWEYGAILEKITYDELPVAQENPKWNLVDGQSYDPNVFTKPQVSAKFFSKKDTFQIPMSFAQEQVKSAFQNAAQLNSFFSMIETAIDTSMTVKIDELAMGALNSMIATTIHSANPNRAINLLTLYNTGRPQAEQLTATNCIYEPEFIRFASYVMGLYAKRLPRLSKLFNEGGRDRFTPRDRMRMILLAEFESAAAAYLYSDTYHNELVRLPAADVVPYWQGTGLSYGFTSTSKIDVQITVRTVVEDQETFSKVNVSQTGILGVIYDNYAVGASNLRRYVTANYNGLAEFFNNWYKFECGYFNDPNENFLVFYVA